MMKVKLFKFFFIIFCFIPFLCYAKEGISYDIDQEWLNLLHYENGNSIVDKNSSFFISPVGHTNPETEFEATLEAFTNNETNLICQFPARLQYIEKKTGQEFIKPQCKAYEEFRLKVPIDNVYVVFASENNTMPTSVMGHIFLKISGISEGRLRKHAFSYFASDGQIDSAKFYWDVIVSSIDGIYALTPYQNKLNDYLTDEQRPVWELELKMSPEQKEYLHKHMWELKGQNVRYSFILHNCGTGTVNIVKLIYPKIIDTKPYKIFETPIDYIKMFQRGDIIENVSLTPSKEYELKSKNGHPKSILDAKPSSQLYLGYNNHSNDSFELKYMPLYQDFYDVSKAYFDDIETKMLNIDLIYNHKLYINKIDILNMRSIVDASSSLDLSSKYLKFSFENRLGKSNTAIKPVFEGGVGYGYAFFNQKIKTYVLPKFGYRYDKVNNFYFTPEMGIIVKPVDDIKIIVSYEKYFDSKYNNRGFDEKLSANFAYLLFNETTLYIKYNKYSGSDLGDDEFSMGIGYSF